MNYDNTKMIRVFQTAGNILQDITEMSVPRGKFSASQLDSLRKAYEKINTVDPNSPAAKRMFELLDSMSKDQLKQVIDAKIKFLSKLAFRRFNRMQNPSKYPSDKLGEEVSEDSFTISEASEAIVKKGTKFKAGVPMWFHTTFKGLQKYPNQVVAGWKTELKTGSGMPGYITYGLHSDGLGKYTVYHLGSGQTKIVSKPLGVFDSPEEAMIFVEDDVLKESATPTDIADTARQILEGNDLSEAKEMYAVVTFHNDGDAAKIIDTESDNYFWGLLKYGVKPEREKKGLYWLTFETEKKLEKFLEKYKSKIASAHKTNKNPKDL